MSTIRLNNGNQIFYTSNSNVVRGKRSKLISFYCVNCKQMHIDVPTEEFMYVNENVTMCKTSYESVIKYLKEVGIGNIPEFNQKTITFDGKSYKIGPENYDWLNILLHDDSNFKDKSKFKKYINKYKKDYPYDVAYAELYDPKSDKYSFLGIFGNARPKLLPDTSIIALKNGNVLITGGTVNMAPLKDAIMYDATKKTFIKVSDMNFRRSDHTSIVLNDGRVLITGGKTCDVKRYSRNCHVLNNAEIFDPKTSTFTLLDNKMKSARRYHNMITLKNGKVLITGGADGRGYDSPTHGYTNTAEIFDPNTNTFTSINLLKTTREYRHPKSVLLSDGKVLFAGGWIIGEKVGSTRCRSTVEVFDPETNQFNIIGKLKEYRCNPQLAVLSNNKVLVYASDYKYGKKSMEIYDLNKNTTTSYYILNGYPTGDQSNLIRINQGIALITGGTFYGEGRRNSKLVILKDK